MEINNIIMEIEMFFKQNKWAGWVILVILILILIGLLPPGIKWLAKVALVIYGIIGLYKIITR